MLELVKHQKKGGIEEGEEEERYFSASEMQTWEKKHRKANRKYIEALRASISSEISGKLIFHNAIASVC